MMITCPKCKCDLELQHTAQLPDEASRLTVTMQSTTNAFAADSAAETILNTVRAVQSCAKAIGQNVAVFLERCEVNGGTVKFDLQILPVKP